MYCSCESDSCVTCAKSYRKLCKYYLNADVCELKMHHVVIKILPRVFFVVGVKEERKMV